MAADSFSAVTNGSSLRHSKHSFISTHMFLGVQAASRVLAIAVFLLQHAVKGALTRAMRTQTDSKHSTVGQSLPSPFELYREVKAASEMVRLQQQMANPPPPPSLLHHACICMGQFVYSSTAGTQLIG
jgi:hypothetical protein